MSRSGSTHMVQKFFFCQGATDSFSIMYNGVSGLNSPGSRVASATVAHRRCADNGRDHHRLGDALTAGGATTD